MRECPVGRKARPPPEATPMNILTVNLLLSTLVFAIAAKLYLLPRLPELDPKAVVLPILLLHAMRHLGLMFLAPGAVHLAGGARRPRHRRAGADRDSGGGARVASGAAAGRAVQPRRYPRPDR